MQMTECDTYKQKTQQIEPNYWEKIKLPRVKNTSKFTPCPSGKQTA